MFKRADCEQSQCAYHADDKENGEGRSATAVVHSYQLVFKVVFHLYLRLLLNHFDIRLLLHHVPLLALGRHSELTSELSPYVFAATATGQLSTAQDLLV